jgi:hypothetical protein
VRLPPKRKRRSLRLLQKQPRSRLFRQAVKK